MKDQDRNDRPADGKPAQPWHAADEQRPAERKSGAPLGTHSFTGGGAEVGMPEAKTSTEPAERSAPRDQPPGTAEPDPLAEPRANVGEILGRKP
jgi:hypothetical protein